MVPWSIPAGAGTKGSASLPFPGPACWKPRPLRPHCGKSRGTGRWLKGNWLGWVFFEVGAEGAVCRGKWGVEKCGWEVQALAAPGGSGARDGNASMPGRLAGMGRGAQRSSLPPCRPELTKAAFE